MRPDSTISMQETCKTKAQVYESTSMQTDFPLAFTS